MQRGEVFARLTARLFPLLPRASSCPVAGFRCTSSCSWRTCASALRPPVAPPLPWERPTPRGCCASSTRLSPSRYAHPARRTATLGSRRSATPSPPHVPPHGLEAGAGPHGGRSMPLPSMSADTGSALTNEQVISHKRGETRIRRIRIRRTERDYAGDYIFGRCVKISQDLLPPGYKEQYAVGCVCAWCVWPSPRVSIYKLLHPRNRRNTKRGPEAGVRGAPRGCGFEEQGGG